MKAHKKLAEEATRAKENEFELFESQLEMLRNDLAQSRLEATRATQEVDELYGELQLAHDQLVTCKKRLEIKHALENDMQATLNNIKSFSSLC